MVWDHPDVFWPQSNFSLRPEPIGVGSLSSNRGSMLPKLLYLSVLLFVALSVCSATFHRKKHYIDVVKYNAAYYNLETGVGLKAELEDSGRDPSAAKISFRGLPCHCENLTCSCCTGVNITAINFNRRACTKFIYEPSEFAVKIMLTMNERVIYSNTISGKNPPPLCVPMPYLPFLNFCMRLYDIYTVDRNIHACMDLETRVVGSPILILHFDCVKMGTDGISWTKPGIGDGTSLETKPEVISEPEVYDEVDFEQQDLEIYVNYTSTLRPEEEAQIGQLKL